MKIFIDPEGLLDGSTHFGSGIAKGRLRVPTEGTVPKLDLELQAARQRARLFERVFGRRLTFRQGLKRPSRRR